MPAGYIMPAGYVNRPCFDLKSVRAASVQIRVQYTHHPSMGPHQLAAADSVGVLFVELAENLHLRL